MKRSVLLLTIVLCGCPIEAAGPPKDSTREPAEGGNTRTTTGPSDPGDGDGDGDATTGETGKPQT